MSARTEAVGELVMDCMDRIAAQFKPGAKVTVIVRRPSHPDGSQDLVVTADDIGDVIAALLIQKAATSLVYEAPRDLSVPLRIRGVSRVGDEPRALLLALNERPTDDEMRALHDHLSEVVIA